MLIYPLEWPVGWARARQHANAKFGHAGRGALLASAREFLLVELERLDAKEIVISTMIPVGAGGMTWRDISEPKDHGAAVYFRIANQARALACDKWLRVADNVQALAKHVEAIRGQIRWGVGSVDQAFGGYKALPAMSARKLWHEVLGLPHTANDAQIRAKRLELLARLHPDRPGTGDAEAAADINQAFNEALAVLRAEARA